MLILNLHIENKYTIVLFSQSDFIIHIGRSPISSVSQQEPTQVCVHLYIYVIVPITCINRVNHQVLIMMLRVVQMEQVAPMALKM